MGLDLLQGGEGVDGFYILKSFQEIGVILHFG